MAGKDFPDFKRPSLVLFLLLVAVVLAVLGIEFLLELLPGLFNTF